MTRITTGPSKLSQVMAFGPTGIERQMARTPQAKRPKGTRKTADLKVAMAKVTVVGNRRRPVKRVS